MINLLPPAVKAERSYGRKNQTLLGYCFLLLLTALATGAIMIGSLQFVGSDESKLGSDIASAQAEITSLESNIQSIEAIAERLDTAKELSDLAVSFSDLIPKIGEALPKGVILNALSLTGGITDPLQLDVDLASADLAPILVRNLVESELFEAADISSLSPKGSAEELEPGSPQSQYKFTASLTASFAGSAEVKRKADAAAAAKATAAQQAQAQEQAQ